MKIWDQGSSDLEQKYLVVRRDGTMPAWPHFVIAARDPIAPEALRAYALAGFIGGIDPEYCRKVLALATDFSAYRMMYGPGDPGAPLDRSFAPDVESAMNGSAGPVLVWPERLVNFGGLVK